MTGLDVEAARKVLLDSLPRDPKWVAWVDGAVERLTECVTPQVIDRDALRHELAAMFTVPDGVFDDEAAADRILALVRRVGAVTLTPEEARIAAAWYTGDPQEADSAAELALALRLEASS